VLGAGPGPYISTRSRSVYVSLGKRVAFLGVDCRTERTREEVVSEHTYDLALDRCRDEIVRGETRHLIVLLGIPIAYPRLVWLENVLTSRALDPLKALGRMGVLGGLMNKFDGGVEILDDLDDHWTARNHKHERNWFVEELQILAAEKSIRITILR
jgi:PhoD related phosphatase